MNANRILPITLALALLAVVPAAVSAHPGGHGNGDNPHQQQTQATNGNNQPGDNNQGNDNNNQGAAPHECVNPAGHTRGWCKHDKNGNQTQNQQLAGIITAVNGTTITILRGLIPVSFDASAAINNGNVNGALYVTRSITAYGYYDSKNYFHARSIR